MIDIHNDLYKVTCEGSSNIEIYYIDYLSTDLTVSPHLIPEKLYNKSIQYIAKLFPHFYGDLIVYYYILFTYYYINIITIIFSI